MSSTLLKKIAPVIAVACFAATCAEPPTTSSPMIGGPDRVHASSSPTLVECPTTETFESSELIGLLGGSVSAGGTTVTIPAGALLVPTTISLTVPASKYMEVEIRADGLESFSFESAITVSVGYGRCTRTNIDKDLLTVWYIDSATKALIENMGGTDDKNARTVTFSTDHLSGYAVAN